MRIRDILRIDYLLLLPVLVLLVLGILFIYSSGINTDGVQVSDEYSRQIVWAAAGFFAALLISMINYRSFYKFSFHIYIISLALLLYTLLFGYVISSASRWLRIGSFGLQVSEVVKVTVIVYLARFLADTDRKRDTFSRFLISCVIVFIPTGLVLLQPDLGTALVYIAILITMLFISEVKMRYVAFMLSCIALSGIFLVLPLWQTYIFRRTVSFMVFLTDVRIILITSIFFFIIAAIAVIGFIKFKKRYFFWVIYICAIIVFSLGASYAARIVLRDYQIMRLIVFIDPQVDPRGAGWNIIQSVTAIGAGGLRGTGFLQGTQSQFQFLPEQSTDFIFSIFSEEAGFAGGVVVFLLYIFICHRFLAILKTVSDPFGKYVCAGLVGMFSFHFIINVGMTMGIMPITGIPLLFMSYGGSSVLTSMIGIGIAFSIYVRRYNR